MNKKRIINFFQNQGALFALIVLVIIALIRYPVFSNFNNITNILRQNSMIGIISIAMAFVILTGGIDLSVGAIAALSSVLVATLSSTNNILLILGIPLSVGLLLGLLNGLVITQIKVAPFISSLGVMMIARGIALVLTSGKSVLIDKVSKGWITAFAKSSFLFIPSFVFVLVGVGIIGIYVSKMTTFGRRIYAIGGNEEAAKMMGIQTEKVKISVYAISGFVAALSGVLLASRLGSGQPVACEGWEMTAIAAVAIGGINLSGGRGNVGGAIYGILILGVINNMINLQGTLNSWWQSIITGVLLLVVILFQAQTEKKVLVKGDKV